MKEQTIKKLTEREHVLLRPGMYLGSSTSTRMKEFILEDGKFKYKEIEYVPGLVKIFNELIDNSIDEHVRTNCEYATKIDVNMDNYIFTVKDNGRGIPVKEVETNEGLIYQPELAWTHARAGSNFEDDNSTTIGTNGVGSMIASVFSKEFTGISDDGYNKCMVRCKNNNTDIKTSISKSSRSQGTKVTIIPDVEKFGLNKITDNHIKMIEQRLYNLSVAYPFCTFRFNNKRIKLKPKNYLEKFGENGTLVTSGKYSIGVFHSGIDEFQHFTLMNGLSLTSGGTQIDYLSNIISNKVREKISRKYKDIKPGDVKQKLFLVVIMTEFKGPKYETQTKEKLINPTKEIRSYFEDLNLDSLADKVYRNKNITDSIIDYFRIKEEHKKKQELKGLDKPIKKIKSEKYTKAIGSNELLVICEGQSARTGLLPGLGRKGIAYYELRGKPMNVYEASQQKFTTNKELTELYQIIKNEGFSKVAVASDADLDGIAINGLLIAFFNKYLSEYFDDNKIYRFQTPVMALLDKSKNPVEWIYDLNGELEKKPGLNFKYFKGLGGFTPDQLKHIIKVDGLDKCLLLLEKDTNSDITINEWYSSSKADARKDKIVNNNFNLIKL